MRLRQTLAMGIPVALLAIAATMLGTERVKALRCHVTQCSATDRVARLCRLIAETEDVPIAQQAAARQLALQGTWPTTEMSELLSEFETAPMGGAYDVIMDALEADGQGEFFCPAFTRSFAGPVAVTPRRIIVQGSTLVRLQQGTVPAGSLGLNLLEIEGLERALGYTRDGTTLQVNAPEDLPVQLMYQLAYSLGRAGVPQINFVFQGKFLRTMQVDLPAYGTCPECLLDLPESGNDNRALTVIGRHDDGPGVGHADPPTLVVLPKDGPHFTKDGPNRAQREFLAVLAAPNRTMKDLVRAVRAIRGPTAAPRYKRLVLAVLADRSIPTSASAQSPQFATHAGLTAVSASPKKTRAARTPARSRTTSKSTAQTGWVPTPLPASSEQIAASIAPKLRSVKDCYEQALRHKSRLTGKVTLHFDIDANGRTKRVRLEDHSLGSKQVTDCIARRARQWRLPAPQDAPVSVAYPLVFAPTGF